jgi:hypothetical protein
MEKVKKTPPCCASNLEVETVDRILEKKKPLNI